MVFSWGQAHVMNYSIIIAMERLVNKLPIAAAAKVTSLVCCVNCEEAINILSLLELIYKLVSKWSWTFPGRQVPRILFLKHLHLFHNYRICTHLIV